MSREILCIQRRTRHFSVPKAHIYGTLELDHDACPPVNGFTPNRLVLTIFNGRLRSATPCSLEYSMLSITCEHSEAGNPACGRRFQRVQAGCKSRLAAKIV